MELTKKQINALAKRLIWLAYSWNDHNFDAAHIEARRECAVNGISSEEEAEDAWETLSRRTAEPQPAEPSPAPCSAYNHAEKDATKEGCECRKLSPAPSGDVIERIKAILAREFPALLILHDRLSKEICSIARADLLANPPQEWLDKRDAEWEAAIPQAYVACNPSKTLEQGACFSGIVRARLTPKPVERVTLGSIGAEIDGAVHEALQLPLGGKESDDLFNKVRELSTKYAELRADLAKEAVDGKRTEAVPESVVQVR